MPKKCELISHPNLMPGWGCCGCNTYNGLQREECKVCQHECCAEPEDNEEEPKITWS